MTSSLVAFVLTAAVGELPAEYYQDFRDGKPLAAEFGPTGARVTRLVTPTAREGLRVHLPANRKKLDPAGVVSRFAVQGDFEITASYKIIQADVPAKGFGVGVFLTVHDASAEHRQARVGWLVRGKEREVAFWDKGSGSPPKLKGGDVPSDAREGRLRLKRIGDKLQFFIAKGSANEDFQFLHDCEFGTADLEQVGLVAVTSKEPVNLDMRWLDLRIAAEALPGQPTRVWTTRSLWFGFGIGLAALLLVAGTIVVLRWRRPTKSRQAPRPIKERHVEERDQ